MCLVVTNRYKNWNPLDLIYILDLNEKELTYSRKKKQKNKLLRKIWIEKQIFPVEKSMTSK